MIYLKQRGGQVYKRYNPDTLNEIEIFINGSEMDMRIENHQTFQDLMWSVNYDLRESHNTMDNFVRTGETTFKDAYKKFDEQYKELEQILD